MRKRTNYRRCALLLTFASLLQVGYAASCTTQSQMTPMQRDSLSFAAHNILEVVQNGDAESLRAKTMPAVAENFEAIAGSMRSLKPLVQGAVITVDNLYSLDASTDPPGEVRTQFFCGSPMVVVTFNALPPGTYALALLHATGVSKPQQVSIILAKSAPNQWLLAGLYSKPMIEAGHDGLWYWVSARKFAQMKMDWNAWFYYRVAADLLDPLDFLSSPNLQKLQAESEKVHPPIFPGDSPMTLRANGSSFSVTAIDTTTEFGGLDIDLHYAPSPTQVSELRDPLAARKQVTDVMKALVALHPELQGAFRGIWVHADENKGSLFALDLPMNVIAADLPVNASSSTPVVR
jgi:hypothetical protein